MNQSIYANLYHNSYDLLYENLKLLIRECQIFSKYFLSMDWFIKHLSLPFWIVGRCANSLTNMLKVVVLFLPGLFDKPAESLIYLTAGLFLESLNLLVSAINFSVALLSLPVRLAHSGLRLTKIIDTNHIDDDSIENTIYTSLRF